MPGYVSHTIVLPNGLRATAVARANGTDLEIVRLYLHEPDGSFRQVDLPTTDPVATQVIDYVTAQGGRLRFSG